MLSATDNSLKAQVGTRIGNQLVGASNPSLIESHNPSNKQLLGKITGGTLNDYQTVLETLTESFNVWRMIPAPKRGEVVRLMGEALRAHKDELGSLVSMEMGKSLQEGLGEVQEMIDIADFAVGQSRMLYGKTMHSERELHRMYEQWHPYGIVGVISAFNFPVAVWAWNAFIAAICGNVVLWKPSHKASLCALRAHEICSEVVEGLGYPPIFGILVTEERDAASAMLDDSRVPLVSFTGSTQTGKLVAQRVAARLGRSILELGGNNAIIIDQDADLDLVIPAVVFGAVGTCGQRCTSTRRLFVHQSIVDDVQKRLLNAYQQVTIGDPLDQKNLMGPLIDEFAVESFKNAIEKIKSKGGKVLFGGATHTEEGYFVEPTLVTDVNNQWDIVQEETFAPILYVMPFETISEAIDMQNGVKQGLSSAIFTNSVKSSELFLSAKGSDCGIANVNIGTSGAEIGGAFGGEKETGGGRESGSDAWKGYMRRQTNTINWSDELPLAQGIEFDL